MNYASPGFTDFMGLAAIIEQLKEILMHYIPNKKQEEECRILEQKRIELQIKNLKNMGFSSLEIKKIVLLEESQLENINKLLLNGKIKTFEIKENK